MRTAISHLAIACLILFTGAVYACDIAAADYYIRGAVVEHLQHLWQQPLVMLQIGIHDGDIG